MEHFRIMLTQQKEALQKDIEANNAKILEAEEALEKLKEVNKTAHSELRSIEKRLGKL